MSVVSSSFQVEHLFEFLCFDFGGGGGLILEVFNA